MERNRIVVIAAVVVVFVAIGAYLAFTGGRGGGQHLSIRIEVNGSTMSPVNPTATQGDSVTMTITADRKEEIHLHGYDIAFEVPGPGESVTKTFRADKSGGFEMEIEDTSTPLGTFSVNPR